MSTPTKSPLTKRLPRHRLWLAGVGVAGIAMIAGWMMLDTNPGNALMRPPVLYTPYYPPPAYYPYYSPAPVAPPPQGPPPESPPP